MARPQLADISSFQPANINWQAYKAWSAAVDGVSRVIMRVNEGTGAQYIDANFQENRKNALAAGIDQIIYYHYAYPQFNMALPSFQFFQSLVGPIRPTDVIMLDWEEENPASTAQWALDWLNAAQAAYPKNWVILYSYYSMILHYCQDARLANYALYYANWQYSPDEQVACPPPWKNYVLLQWSDMATVPGIPGTVDGDVYIGGLNTVSPQPNPHFDQEALDCWESFLVDVAHLPTPPPTNTAIFADWKRAWQAGHQFGPPLTSEYASINGAGQPIVCQQFAGARAEHYSETQQTNWFTAAGQVKF